MGLPWVFNLITFTSGFTFFSFIFLIPLYAHELGLSLTAAGVALAASSVAIIAFSPVWGALADRLGRKRPFLVAGYGLFALFSALHALAGSFPALVALRFLQGAAFATNPLLTALFADRFGRQAARRFGAFSAANALGWGLGSLVSGLLADWIGLRWTFAVVAGLPLVSAALLLRVPEPSSPAPPVSAREPEPSRPRLPRKLFYLYATIFTRHSAAVALWSMFPLYLREFVGSLGGIGAVNGLNMIAQPLFMLLFGRWAERWDKLQLVLWGILGTIATFGVYATATGIGQILLGQLMIAAAWSAIFIGLNLYLMEAAPPGTRGRAFGLLQSSMTGAAALGPLLGGALADALGIRGMIWVVAALMGTSLPFLLKLRALDAREAAQRALTATATTRGAAEPVGCGCRSDNGDGGGAGDGCG